MTNTKAESNIPPTSRQRETRKLRAIEIRSAQILALALLASLWFRNGAVFWGLILGGGLAILNFHWLRRILEKAIFDQQWLYSFQILIKFIFLGGAIYIVLRYAKVHPVAFVAGISTLLMGILFEVLREYSREKKEADNG